MTKSIISVVKARILKHGPGWCFTPRHFLDLNSSTGVRTALSRLEEEKVIRRLAQGLYEYPRHHDDLGMLPPEIDQIAKALSEKNNIKIFPAGAYAANLVGLTEQVPSKVVFLTNGPSKKIKIGKLEIYFKTATEKSLSPQGKVGLAVSALKNMGRESVDEVALKKIKRFLQGTSEQEISKNLKYASQWVRDLILRLMGIIE